MSKQLALALALMVAAGIPGLAQSLNAPSSAGGGAAYYEFLLGLHLESGGDAAGAAAAYQRAEKLDPGSADIPAALAELYARMNRPTDAIAAGERAVTADAANPEANWILGNLYSRLAEGPNTRDADRPAYTRRAIAHLEQANANAHAGVPLMLGRLYMANRQFEEALRLLGPMVVDQPDNVEAVALLAEVYQLTDRETEAVALLERSTKETPELFATLAEIYESSGRWRDAARVYEGAVQERPQSLPLRAQWATALLNADDPQRARQVLEDGSVATSKNPRALDLLAEAQRRTQDMAAAEATARRLIALDAKALGGPRELALIFRDQGDYQKVVGALEPVVSARFRAANEAEVSDEAFRSVYFDLVSVYQQLKQFDKAIALLTQARTIVPTSPIIDIRLARTQVNAGKGDNAVATLTDAVAKFPDQPLVKMELASMLERQKKYSEAEVIFKAMIAADPKDADALNSFAYMLAERGQRLDESVSLVQRALALDPGNPAYLDSLGWAYYKQNKLDLAEPPLREAAAKLSDVSVIQSHLGDLLNKRGLYQEAVDAWERALRGDGESVTRADLEDKIKSGRQKLGKKK